MQNSYGFVQTPRTDKLNSCYSVKQINSKIVPWLTFIVDDKTTVHVQAGTTLKEFLNICKQYQTNVSVYIQHKF